MKTCSKCGVEKPLTEFGIRADRKDGTSTCCKLCNAEKSRERRTTNPELTRASCRRSHVKHLDERKKVQKAYRILNRLRRRKYQREYLREKQLTDFDYRFHKNVRTNIIAAIMQAGGNKCGRTKEILGCSESEFRTHLEKLFLPGMGLENYPSIWEIGHRKPCAYFDMSDSAQQKECWHYSNLFPQYVEDNRKSGALYAEVDFKGLRAEQYSVRPIDLATARALLEIHHYSGTAPSAATRCYGLLRKDAPDILLGAAVWRPAPLGSAKQQCPEDPQAVLCLSRLAILPGVAKNAASYFLACCLRQLKQEKKWTIAVTYADTWQGHDGGIYKAANWEYLGLTAPQPVWTLGGKFIGKRLGSKTLTSAELLARGAIFQGKFAKHIYQYKLT